MKSTGRPDPSGWCLHCGAPLRFSDKRCPRCHRPNNNWIQPGKNSCGNCHAPLGENDAYCRVCGTKAGEGAFEPFQNLMQCIYGPMPVTRTHTCPACGYGWTTYVMIDKDRFCPRCGTEAKMESPDAMGMTFVPADTETPASSDKE